MEAAWGAVSVATDATVAHVYFQREAGHWDGEIELDITAVA